MAIKDDTATILFEAIQSVTKKVEVYADASAPEGAEQLASAARQLAEAYAWINSPRHTG